MTVNILNECLRILIDCSQLSKIKFGYMTVNILNECLRILIDCSQLSKTYYNVLFDSFTRDRHARHIYLRTFAADEKHL